LDLVWRNMPSRLQKPRRASRTSREASVKYQDSRNGKLFFFFPFRRQLWLTGAPSVIFYPARPPSCLSSLPRSLPVWNTISQDGSSQCKTLFLKQNTTPALNQPESSSFLCIVQKSLRSLHEDPGKKGGTRKKKIPVKALYWDRY
jgi:hypothetical protein